LSAVGVPRHEQGGGERLHGDPPRRHPEECGRHHADPHGAVRAHRLPHLRAEARCAVRAEEVLSTRSIKRRNHTMAEAKVLSGAGLRGQVAGQTELCTVGKTGAGLTYRGYDVRDLAAQCCFEEVAYLLLYGELPNKAQLDAYQS